MKIRNGFVSNSSSSSFVVIGKEFNYDTLEGTKSLLHALGYDDNYIQENLSKLPVDKYGKVDSYKLDAFRDMDENPAGLDVVQDQESSYAWVGVELTSIKKVISVDNAKVEELASKMKVDVKEIEFHSGEISC